MTKLSCAIMFPSAQIQKLASASLICSHDLTVQQITGCGLDYFPSLRIGSYLPDHVHLNASQKRWGVEEFDSCIHQVCGLMDQKTSHTIWGIVSWDQESSLYLWVTFDQKTFASYVFDVLPQGIFCCSVDQIITDWNPSCTKILGYAPHEVLGEHVSVLMPPDKHERLQTIRQALRRGQAVFQAETVWYDRQGRELELRFSIFPIIAPHDQRIQGAVVLFQDIADEKRTHEIEKRQGKAVEALSDSLEHLLTHEDFYEGIRSAFHVLCSQMEVHCGQLQLERSSPKTYPYPFRLVWNAQEGGTYRQDFETLPKTWEDFLRQGGVIRRATVGLDGQERQKILGQDTKYFVIVPLHHQGEISGFLSLENVSDKNFWSEQEIVTLVSFASAIEAAFSKKEAENAVRESEQRFRWVFQASQEAMATLDAQNCFVMLNPAGEKLFGCAAAHLSGMPIQERLEGFMEKMEEIEHQQEEQEHRFTCKGSRLNGTTFIAEISFSPMDRHNRGLRLLVLRDITQRHLEEERRDRARQQEIEIGFKIQNSLLLGRPPKNFPGVDLAPLTLPSQGIDGDFYDFFLHGHSCFDLLIGDVMGKGIPAALLAAATKSAFNHAITSLTTTRRGVRLPSPEEVLRAVHSEVSHEMLHLESFMTVFFCRFDFQKHLFTYVDAGHGNTLHYQAATKTLVKIEGDNVPLGCLESEEYHQFSKPFASGDVFLFFSDGITEAMSSERECYGLERLQETLLRLLPLHAEDIARMILKSAREFSHKGVHQDDLTCVVVKVSPENSDLLLQETFELTPQLWNLQKMRTFVKSFLNRCDPFREDEDLVLGLEICANEVASNIMIHGFDHESLHKIKMICRHHLSHLVISFDYPGAPFVPEPLPEKPDHTKGGGFGLFIIDAMVDEVHYMQVDESVQRIQLIKYSPL